MSMALPCWAVEVLFMMASLICLRSVSNSAANVSVAMSGFDSSRHYKHTMGFLAAVCMLRVPSLHYVIGHS